MIGKPAIEKGTYGAYGAYSAYSAYGAYRALKFGNRGPADEEKTTEELI
jgi:hypothetical protein